MSSEDPPTSLDSDQPVAPANRPHPLSPLIHGWITLVGASLSVLRETVEGTIIDVSQWGFGICLFTVIIVLQLIYGVFEWLSTRFVVLDDEFRIERTFFLANSSSRVNYAKIQSVEIFQPFAARIFGLAKLHISVGAGPGKDIQFLKKDHAEQLRATMMLRARPAASPEPALQACDDAPSSATAAKPEEPIITVKPLHLIGYVLLSWSFVIPLVLGLTILLAKPSIGTTITAAIFLVPMVGIAWSNLIGSWNYRITRSGTSLQVSHGLTSVYTRSISRDRVQGIRISRSLLCKPFGLWSIRVTSLGLTVSRGEAHHSDLVLPAGTWKDVTTAIETIWPEIDLAGFDWQPQPPAARWLTWFTYRYRSWAVTSEVAATRRGLLSTKIDLVPHARVQGITLRQGPLQRQLDLASVEVTISVGAVHAVAGHLGSAAARDLAWKLVDLGREARASSLNPGGPLRPQLRIDPGPPDSDPSRNDH